MLLWIIFIFYVKQQKETATLIFLKRVFSGPEMSFRPSTAVATAGQSNNSQQMRMASTAGKRVQAVSVVCNCPVAVQLCFCPLLILKTSENSQPTVV